MKRNSLFLFQYKLENEIRKILDRIGSDQIGIMSAHIPLSFLDCDRSLDQSLLVSSARPPLCLPLHPLGALAAPLACPSGQAICCVLVESTMMVMVVVVVDQAQIWNDWREQTRDKERLAKVE